MGMTIEDCMKESHAIAVEHGWWENGERDFGEQVALMHSELSECLEEYRVHGMNANHFIYFKGKGGEIHDNIGMVFPNFTYWKPEGVAIEFADVMIRLFDTAEKYKISIHQNIQMYVEIMKPAMTRDEYATLEISDLIDVFHQNADERNLLSNDNFGHWIARCHRSLSDAFTQYLYTGRFDDVGLSTSLAFVLNSIFTISGHYQIPIQRALIIKTAFNKSRPYRHGGKLA